jgi:hypothetical protein
MTGSVKGFFTNVEDSDRTNCPGNNCLVIEPAHLGFGSFTTKTDRDVDYWGGQAEAKFGNPEPVQVRQISCATTIPHRCGHPWHRPE